MADWCKGSIQEDVANQTNSGKIIIENTLKGKTYTIYQVLELESFDDERNAYTYNAASDEWEDFLNSAAVKGKYLNYDSTLGVWTWVEGADAQAFAQLALTEAETNTNISSVASKKSSADNEVITFSDLELGYYLVDSTAGALCNLTTTHAVTTIKEKNAVPTVKKEVQEDSNLKYGENNTADYFQVVNFKTSINVETGAENYVLVDVMSDGLSLKTDSFVLTHANGTIVPSGKYTISTSGDKLNVNYNNVATTATFVIDFDDAYMASLKDKVDELDLFVNKEEASSIEELLGNYATKNNGNELFLNGNYTFYARWSFSIFLNEAPGTTIKCSFPETFLYRDEYNVDVPINNKKGFSFTIIKSETFAGEADVNAHVLLRDEDPNTDDEYILREVTVQKYHDDMYVYTVAPEDINGVLINV